MVRFKLKSTYTYLAIIAFLVALSFITIIISDSYSTFIKEKDIAERQLINKISKGLCLIDYLEHDFKYNSDFDSLKKKINGILLSNKDVKSISYTEGDTSTFFITNQNSELTVKFTESKFPVGKEEEVQGDSVLFRVNHISGQFFVDICKIGVDRNFAVEIYIYQSGHIRIDNTKNRWLPLNVSGKLSPIVLPDECFDISWKCFAELLATRLFLLFLALFLPYIVAGSYFKQLIKDDTLKIERYLDSSDENSTNELRLLKGIKPIIHKANVHSKELEVQLDECRDRLSQFYQASVDAILIHSGGVPLFFNPALEELTGYKSSELEKKTPFEFIEIEPEILSELREQRQPAAEALLKRKNGDSLYVEIQIKPVTYRGQKSESIVIRNITHRKFMERELQIQRMRQVKSVIDGQEKERQRLSRELHDGLGQNLVAIKLKLESIPPNKDEELNNTLSQVKHMFSHTIEEVRRISNNLMPAALKEFSLAVVLRNLCNEVESNSGINISLSVGVLPEPIDQLLKTYIYRIVQEALTNVIKHSGASKASVAVYADFSNLHLQIEDNGEGFNTSANTDTGNGLYNMKERAVLLNGKISFISSKGKGTKVVAEFPLQQQKNT